MQKLKGDDAEMRLKAHREAADVYANGGNRVIINGAVPTPVLIALLDDGFSVTPTVDRTVLSWADGKLPWLGTQQDEPS